MTMFFLRFQMLHKKEHGINLPQQASLPAYIVSNGL